MCACVSGSVIVRPEYEGDGQRVVQRRALPHSKHLSVSAAKEAHPGAEQTTELPSTKGKKRTSGDMCVPVRVYVRVCACVYVCVVWCVCMCGASLQESQGEPLTPEARAECWHE